MQKEGHGGKFVGLEKIDHWTITTGDEVDISNFERSSWTFKLKPSEERIGTLAGSEVWHCHHQFQPWSSGEYRMGSRRIYIYTGVGFDPVEALFILLHELAHRKQDNPPGKLYDITKSAWLSCGNTFIPYLEIAANKYAFRCARRLGISKERILKSIEHVVDMPVYQKALKKLR